MPLRKTYRSLFVSGAIAVLFLSVFVFSAIVALALPPVAGGPIAVDQIFQTAMNGKNLTCGGPIKGAFVSGKLTARGGESLFTPRNVQVKKLKIKYKSLDDEKARELLKLRIQRISRLVKDENRICTEAGAGALPTPAATAAVTPQATATIGSTFTPFQTPTPRPMTPTPTPTVTPTLDNNSGASIQRGKVIYDGKCASCHRVGNYDTQGGIDLKLRVDRITSLRAFAGFVLTPQEVTDLKNFINSQ